MSNHFDNDKRVLMRVAMSDTVVVIGAGIGGLAAAIRLASAGFQVTVVEMADGPGGKMREQLVAGRNIDCGPTVFTLRSVFDELFEAAGERLDEHLTLIPAEILARHAWADGSRLDLFSDPERSAEAIGDFAGAAAARGFRDFCREGERIFQALETVFLKNQQTSPLGLSLRLGLGRVTDLLALRPYTSMWKALGGHFRDPRLRQLFGRYATYAGCSPFLAPATLMLIAHVESQGVWLPKGGMHALARALEALGRRKGVRFLYGERVREILVAEGRVSGVVLASGERIRSDNVVANADPAAIASGQFGAAVRQAVAPVPVASRSLSALTLALVGKTRGFPLVRHNVFFSADYREEFDDLARGRLPRDPTIYVCAEDRGAGENETFDGAERMLAIVNAPPLADTRPLSAEEISRCALRSFQGLEAMGLQIDLVPEGQLITSPAEFLARYPGSGGAIYGRAAHGPTQSFRRPGARTKLKGLYLAGGGVHPGAGVPMVAQSGRLAAEALMADRASTPRFRPVATSGGMSTR